MKTIITKLDIYLISAAIILAFFVIGLFWTLNKGETPEYMSQQPPPPDKTVTLSDSSKSVESEKTSTNSLPAEKSTINHKGLAKLNELTTVNALVLGDAVAEGQGASKRDESSWQPLVSKALEDKYPGNFQWLVKTAANATIDTVSASAPEAAEDIDLIILCLGRQDWTSVTTDDFRQKYDQLLTKLKAQSPDADVFLIAEPPVKSTENNKKFFPYHQVIIELGKKHQLPVIDEWTAFIQAPAPLAELLADEVNPNDKGYRVFADEVVKKLEEYLSGE